MNKPRNSFEAVKMVLDHAPKDLSNAQRLVLIQIANHYPNPHISQKTLAAEIGVRRIDTVNRAIKVLVNRDLLIMHRQGHMKANKYELNYGSSVYGETVSMTTRQTAVHVYGQTVNKQRTIKEYNKEAFFDFLNNFVDSTVSEAVVLKAWTRALLKGASEDLLVTASRTNRDNLQPDAWLNFEKWKSFKPVSNIDDDSWKVRAEND
jgi:hypothetical protein